MLARGRVKSSSSPDGGGHSSSCSFIVFWIQLIVWWKAIASPQIVCLSNRNLFPANWTVVAKCAAKFDIPKWSDLCSVPIEIPWNGRFVVFCFSITKQAIRSIFIFRRTNDNSMCQTHAFEQCTHTRAPLLRTQLESAHVIKAYTCIETTKAAKCQQWLWIIRLNKQFISIQIDCARHFNRIFIMSGEGFHDDCIDLINAYCERNSTDFQLFCDDWKRKGFHYVF